MMISLVLGAALAAPPRGTFGVGVAGGPGVTGLSGKFYMRRTSVQVVFGGWQLLTEEMDVGNGLGVSGDYLLEMPDLVYTQRFNLAWHLGVGGTWALPSASTDYVSAAAIVGTAVNFKDTPFDVVFEARPRVAVLPNFWFDLFHYSAHVRYYF